MNKKQICFLQSKGYVIILHVSAKKSFLFKLAQQWAGTSENLHKPFSFANEIFQEVIGDFTFTYSGK